LLKHEEGVKGERIGQVLALLLGNRENTRRKLIDEEIRVRIDVMENYTSGHGRVAVGLVAKVPFGAGTRFLVRPAERGLDSPRHWKSRGFCVLDDQ
jgi:hypothetical protein